VLKKHYVLHCWFFKFGISLEDLWLKSREFFGGIHSRSLKSTYMLVIAAIAI
jgi:hypothetical protein